MTLTDKREKSANGEGSIFQRGDKYIVQLCIGKNENGKRVFKTATASTKTEAVDKLNELKEKYGKISSVEMAKAPLETLIRNWFEDKKNSVLYQKSLSYVMNSVSGRKNVCEIKNPNELLHNGKLENNNVFRIKEIGKKFCDFSAYIDEFENNLDSYLFTFSHCDFPFDTYVPQIKFNTLIIQENFGFTQSDVCKYYSEIDGKNYIALFKNFIQKRNIKRWYEKGYIHCGAKKRSDGILKFDSLYNEKKVIRFWMIDYEENCGYRVQTVINNGVHGSQTAAA